uniref:PDZ domain-containing protein n=1 Tax=Ciona savignyi TaxID=51511 RepID=H2ZCB1_CIOSA
MDCITVDVVRQTNEPWGMQVTGESPCYIARVKPSSPADDAGMQVGDCIFSVNGVSTHNSRHAEVVSLIAESGRVARFKLLPVSKDTPRHEQLESNFWTNDAASTSNPRDSLSEQSDDAFDHTDYDSFCKMFDDSTKLNGEKEFTLIPKYNEDVDNTKKNEKSKSIDQSSFIITREDQKRFDKHYEVECTFKGKKASAAGAFTGDHNVIRAGKDSREIRGVRARVLAGIQHFSFGTEQEKIKPEDRGTIIV